MTEHVPKLCPSCGGRFIRIQADGQTYYHACPDGTLFPIDENLIHDVDDQGEAINVRQKKGKVIP